MEERVSPVKDKHPDQEHENHNYVPATDPFLGSGTYVVQVPKDQVYRIPPPENALIIERHRNPASNNSTRSCCCYILLVFIGIVVFTGLIVGVSYIFLKPKDPEFYIQHINVQNPNSNKSRPDYTITVKANNPNGKTSISYEKGGDASLSYKQYKLATGKYPTFNQDAENSKVFDLTLRGSNSALPKEIEKSLESKSSKVHISLLLKMNVEMKLEIVGVISMTKKINVSCDLTVDSLAKATRVLSQECNTNS